MGIKPLIFSQQGATAGIQKDKYTQLPGFVDCENLDIFSSSQSVKATSWSEPIENTIHYVDIDERGRMLLMSDGRVRDSQEQTYITDHTMFDEQANTLYPDLSYTGGAKATFGVPKKLFVLYDGDSRKTIIVFTDRIIYKYYNKYLHCKLKILQGVNIKENIKDNNVITTEYVNKEGIYVMIHQSNTYTSNIIKANIELVDFNTAKCVICIYKYNGSIGDVSIKSIKLVRNNLHYNAETGDYEIDTMGYIPIDITNINEQLANNGDADITFISNKHLGYNHGTLHIELETTGQRNGGIMLAHAKVYESFDYLYPRERHIIKNGDYIYYNNTNSGYNALSINKFWHRVGSQNESYFLASLNEAFMLQGDYSIVSFLRMEELSLLFVNSYNSAHIYAIGLSNEEGEMLGIQKTYTFQGMKILSALSLGTLIYIIAENRGIRGLYAFYNGELKEIMGSESIEKSNRYLTNHTFNFSGIMCVWRNAVIAGTIDNRVFMWREHNGNYKGSFVYTAPGDITHIRPTNEGLIVDYTTSSGKTYSTTLNEDRVIRRYQTSFWFVYPIVIGSHLIEKEAQDIEVSFMIPNKNSSIEVWARVNDYHYWTVHDIEDSTGVAIGDTYYFGYTEYDTNEKPYVLRVVDIVDEHTITFELEGDMPIWTENTDEMMLEKISGSGYSMQGGRVDNFKRIGTVQGTGFKHGKEKFTALTYENKMPTVHTIQIKVVGKGDGKSSPEIYDIYLINNQIDT